MPANSNIGPATAPPAVIRPRGWLSADVSSRRCEKPVSNHFERTRDFALNGTGISVGAGRMSPSLLPMLVGLPASST